MPDPLFPELFVQQVNSTPDACAVVDARTGEEMSYQVLEISSRLLAGRLRSLGVGPEVPVGLLIERSLDMIVAMVGVLRAGAAYVPLDPAAPPGRIRRLVKDAGIDTVISRGRGIVRLGPSPELILEMPEELRSQETEEFPAGVHPENVAYLIYTSGSTGTPKGVVISQRALAWYINAARSLYAFSPFDRGLHFSALNCDVSVLETLVPLACGMTVVLAPASAAESATGYLDCCDTWDITVSLVPTAFWHELADTAARGAPLPPRLRLVIFGGEKVSTRRVRDWHRAIGRRPAPGPRLINGYGPTEATVEAVAYEVSKPPRIGEEVPIGRTLLNACAWVADRKLEILPAQQEGEIIIGGPGVARGYLGQPAMTAEAFVPDPAASVAGPTQAGSRVYKTGDRARRRSDGELEFLGRIDWQVNVRGFRIEPGEIEAALLRHPAVAEAVVVDRAVEEHHQLVAFVVSRKRTPPPAKELRRHLKEILPAYMLPAAVSFIDELPMTPNLKVDRAALVRAAIRSSAEEPVEEDTDAGAPRTPLETTLARIWDQVLGLSEASQESSTTLRPGGLSVGIHDNFFELGGDSILNLRIAARARELGLPLDPKDVFDHPTIAELAEVVSATDRAPKLDALKHQWGATRPAGEVELTPIQRWFFDSAFPDSDHFNQAFLFELRRYLRPAVLEQAVNHLAEHHDALRLRFTGRRQRYAPPGERIPLAVVDLRSLPAECRAATIESTANRLQKSLDLSMGPLLRTVLFDYGLGRGRLLIIIHHLAIDTVSWHVLLGDLETTYEAFESGSSIALLKTTSYQEWAIRLLVHAGQRVPGEFEWWAAMSRRFVSLPRDFLGKEGPGNNLVGSMETVSVSLDARATRRLLRQVPAAYRTQINDVLLTALARTITAWTGSRTLYLDLEGHGREDVIEGVDLSRTVGWFTIAYPVALEVGENAGPGDDLVAVKESLRAVPRHGFGYSLLRYLGDKDTTEALAAVRLPELSFNYFGQLDAVATMSFALARESTGLRLSPRARRDYVLEVDGAVVDGRLTVNFRYSRDLHQRDTIVVVAQEYREELYALIDHCLAPEAAIGFTASDFPLAGLDTAELREALGADPSVEDVYPLSPVQEGLYFHALYDPRSTMYFEQSCWLLEGPLDSTAFREAWERLLHRHAVLRTSFLWLRHDRPGGRWTEGQRGFRQVVHRHLELPFMEEDWGHLGPDEQASRLEVFLEDDRRRGFDLSQAPLWRLYLIRLGEGVHRFVWSNHHILLDGWSVSLLLEEFLAIYESLVAGKPPKRVKRRLFRDYIAWLAAQDRAAAGGFWREYLAGLREPTPFLNEKSPTGSGGSAHLTRGAPLGAAETADLRLFARRARLTLASVVQGAWGLVLGRMSGADDVVFGTTSAGRPQSLPGADGMVGLMINILPVRLRPGRREQLTDWLRRHQSIYDQQRRYGFLTLAEIQAASAIPQDQSLFDSLLGYHNYPGAAALRERYHGVALGDLIYYSQTNYALIVEIHPTDDELELRGRYDPQRFDVTTVKRLLRTLQAVLVDMKPGSSSRSLGELSFLLPAERHQLLLEHSTATWYGGAQAQKAPLGLLHELFEAQAERTPEAVALVFEDRQVRFCELDREATELARQLRGLGVGPEVSVALSFTPCPELIVAVLAVLKAGGAYVPLPHDQPEDRRARLIEESGAGVLIDAAGVSRLRDPFSSNDRVVARTVVPMNLAYVLFTSGTTGRPKGVAVEHRQVTSYLRAIAGHLGLPPAGDGSAGAFLLVQPLSFDASVPTLFLPLVHGGVLHLVSDAHKTDPWYLERYLEEHEIDFFKLSPRHLATLEEALGRRLLPRRWLVVGGEASHRDWSEDLLGAEIPCAVVNHYGPTETTSGITTARVGPELHAQVPASSRLAPRATLPIGRPLAHAEAYVTDVFLNPVPAGIPGELVLGGSSLARGYLGRPARTAAAFVPDPFGEPGQRLYRTGDRVRHLHDGQLEWLGRRDRQIKVRGVRVEPGEIEARLLEHPAVREAVVVKATDHGPEQLVAYVLAAGRFHGTHPVLEGCEAPDDFAGIESASRDTVTLDVSARHLPSMDYLLRLLRGALEALAPDGRLLVDGVSSLSLQEARRAAIELARADEGEPVNELEHRIRQGLSSGQGLHSGEQLVIHPAFFHTLRGYGLPIAEVRVRPRGGNHRDESARFGYDVEIRKDGPSDRRETEEVFWISSYDELSVDAVRQLMREADGRTLGLRRVRDRRLWREGRLLEMLAVAPKTVGELRLAIAAAGPCGLEPDDLEAACRDLSYRLEIAPPDTPGLGAGTVSATSFDALLKSVSPDTAGAADAARPAVAWASYANRPATMAGRADMDTGEEDMIEQWRAVHDFHYSPAVSVSPGSDDTFDITGWNSSYTDQPIPAEEMREWVETTVDRILELSGDRVLEIGCGRGLLLHRVAPRKSRYLGTDFSPTAVAALSPTISRESSPDGPRIEVREQAADDFTGIEPADFDTLVLNSVLQYFPSIEYLVRVLRGVVERLDACGTLFIGDVRSRPLLETFHTSVELFRAENTLSVAELRHRIRRRRLMEKELVVDPAFFHALASELPRVRDVVILPKAGHCRNEMTLFRYDVVLRLDEPLATPFDTDGLEKTARRRLRSELHASELLTLCQGAETVGELREALLAGPDVEGPLPPGAYGFHPRHQRALAGLGNELADDLAARLPDEMVPGAIVVLDALPRRDDGTVDRASLERRPRPGDDRAADGGSAAADLPRGATEAALVEIWSEVLGVSAIGIHDNFFALGGHSLSATQVVSRVRRNWGIELPLRQLFESPTVVALAADVEAELETHVDLETPPLVAQERPPEISPSFAQQRLWFHHRMAPHSVAYHMPEAWHLKGPLDVPAFEAAWRELARRHEVLRTTFAERGGEAYQVIAPELAVALPVVDLGALPRARGAAVARGLADAEAARPFDLERGPLVRLLALRLGPQEHVLVRALHHITSDGWSGSVLRRELSALYGAAVARRPVMLGEPAIQYADFALWQRGWLHGQALEQRLAWWRRQLDGVEPLRLPTDRPRAAEPTYRGTLQPLLLPLRLADGLEELSHRHQGSLFMSVLAGYLALLGRYSGMTDVVVGAPIANRNHEEIEDLIGFFVNSLVLRADLTGNPTTTELLERLREMTLAAYAHQDLPFEKLVEELQPERELHKNPFFQVVFAFQNTPDFELHLDGLECRSRDFGFEPSGVDLELHLWPRSSGLDGYMVWNGDLFDATRIRRMALQLEHLLSEMVARPDRRIRDHVLLSRAERHQILHEWSEREDPPASESFLEIFAEQVRRRGEAPALRFEDTELSYAELHRRAGVLAADLRRRGLKAEDRVGILLERSPELVISLLAVLEAGGVFLVLDPSHPVGRLSILIQDADLSYVLTRRNLDDALLRQVRHAMGRVILWEKLEEQEFKGGRDLDPAAIDGRISGDQLAYMIYTSGSTGRPKGTLLTHRGLANLVRCEPKRPGPGDVALQFAALSFDAMISEMAYTLAGGATLDLGVAGPSPTGEDLLDLLRRRRITWAILPPSILRTLGEDAADRLPELTTLIAAGEALSADVSRRFARGRRRFLNAYGPTEITVCASVGPATATRHGEPSIGRPIPGVRLYVLDRRLRPVAAGVDGELCVGGAGVARGYLGLSALVAERFVPDPYAAGGRLYRTGDRVRWRGNGELDFLGRLDAQIKLRGFRIEPGEIEAALDAHPAVLQGAVKPIEAPTGAILTAFVAPVVGTDPAVLGQRLRRDLTRHLPSHMVPGRFVILDALPLLPSGKVDRRRLVEQVGSRVDPVPRAPLSAIEEILAEIWREVLPVEEVGADDDFFELGGHSLLATQVHSRLRARLDGEIDLRDLFTHSTLARLAVFLEQSQAAAEHAPAAGEEAARPALVSRDANETAPPLSFAQERLWFLERLYPGKLTYNTTEAWMLRGRLDAAAFEASFAAIVRRHEVLRTTFPTRSGKPYQHVAPPAQRPENLIHVDLERLGDRALAEVRRLGRAMGRRPFDLERGPLLRLLLVRLGDETTILVRALHHVITDGWSEAIFLRELAALYRAAQRRHSSRVLSPLPAPRLQYADYAVWQRRWLAGAELERQIDYWRRELDGVRPLDLVTDRPRPARPDHRGDLVPLRLGALLTERLGALHREEGASLYMLLLAALMALFSRLTHQRDLTIGSPIANRNRQETEGMMGFFVNMLVLRGDLSPSDSFREILRRIRRLTLDAYAHQDLPFEKLVQELYASPQTSQGARPPRDPSRNPFFQVSFALLNVPQADLRLRLSGLEVEELDLDFHRSRFDLAWHLAPAGTGSPRGDEGLAGQILYRTALFDKATPARLARQLETLLEAVTLPGGAEGRLTDLPLLAAAEQHQLSVEWSARTIEPPPPQGDKVHELFRQHAERSGKAVALVFEDREWTYAELRRSANRLSHALLDMGAGPGCRVALVLDNSPDAVIAILGTLGAGAAYVPVDPASPPERVAFLLTDARPNAVVSVEAYRDRLADTAARILYLDADAGLLEHQSTDDPKVALEPSSPAYVIYTSGSTGRPKGVVVPHRNVTRLLATASEHFDFTPSDVWTLFHSFAFDFSVWEIWGALAFGGRLVVVPYRTSRSPEDFHELVARRGVTVLNQTPSAFRLFTEADRRSEHLRNEHLRNEHSSLRYVIFGGEALDPGAPAPWIQRHGDQKPQLINMYGITETTVHVTFMRVERGQAPGRHPIGRPLPRWRIHLADRGLRPMPIGAVGEICVGGWGVASGYHDRGALTAERFVPDPWSDRPGARLYKSGDLGRYRGDGQLEYLGRVDHQVQIRGFRVELGEIEAFLGRHPDIHRAVVMVRRESGEDILVAYVVTPPGSGPGLGEVRGFLAHHLPEHMLPAAVVHLEALPLTRNGKIDRRALPAPDAARPEIAAVFVAPESAVEQFLARLWADTLRTSRVGLDDDFFELGGDSIRGALLINALQKELDEIVHVIAIFDHPTIRSMATFLREQYADALLRLDLGGDEGAPRQETAAKLLDEDDVTRFTAAIRPLPSRTLDRRAAAKNPSAIFILSPPRSGTTLLRVMLGGHPRLFAPPELELLSFLSMRERNESFSGRFAFWREGLVRAVMELESVSAREAEEMVAAFETEDLPTREVYARLQGRLGERILVDKSPTYAIDPATLEHAEAIFENPLYIHLVRHPAATIASFVEAKLDQLLLRQDQDMSRRLLAESHWLVSHRNILRFLSRIAPERQHRLYFEELVTAPRSVLERLCDFLGLPFDPAMEEPYGRGDARMTDGVRAESRMLGDVKFHQHGKIDSRVAQRTADTSVGELGKPARRLGRRLGYLAEKGRLAHLEPQPLSYQQRRLWTMHRRAPGSKAAFNIPAVFELAGPLDKTALGRALRELAARHEVLRTFYPENGGEGTQAVCAEAESRLGIVSLAALAAGERHAVARRAVEHEIHRAFNPESEVPLRFVLFELEEDHHVFLLLFHHLFMDGRTQSILLQELSALYRTFRGGGTSTLADPPMQYADFAVEQVRWLTTEQGRAELAYWRDRVRGLPPMQLPADRPRPAVQSFRGQTISFELDAEVQVAFETLGRRHDASLFMTILAGFLTFLHRASGQSDVAASVQIMNRGRPEILDLPGFFNNLLVMRAELGAASVRCSPSFEDALERVKKTAYEAYAHQEMPFHRVAEAVLIEDGCGQLSAQRHPLNEISLAMAGEGRSAFDFPDLEAQALDPESRSTKFDLKLWISKTQDGLEASLVYNTDIFDRTTGQRFAGQIGRLFRAIAENPEAPLSALPILSPGKTHQLLVERNERVSDTGLELDAEDPEDRTVAAARSREP